MKWKTIIDRLCELGSVDLPVWRGVREGARVLQPQLPGNVQGKEVRSEVQEQHRDTQGGGNCDKFSQFSTVWRLNIQIVIAKNCATFNDGFESYAWPNSTFFTKFNKLCKKNIFDYG